MGPAELGYQALETRRVIWNSAPSALQEATDGIHADGVARYSHIRMVLQIAIINSCLLGGLGPSSNDRLMSL